MIEQTHDQTVAFVGVVQKTGNGSPTNHLTW